MASLLYLCVYHILRFLTLCFRHCKMTSYKSEKVLISLAYIVGLDTSTTQLKLGFNVVWVI